MQKKIKIFKFFFNYVEEDGEVKDYGEEDLQYRYIKVIKCFFLLELCGSIFGFLIVEEVRFGFFFSCKCFLVLQVMSFLGWERFGFVSVYLFCWSIFQGVLIYVVLLSIILFVLCVQCYYRKGLKQCIFFRFIVLERLLLSFRNIKCLFLGSSLELVIIRLFKIVQVDLLVNGVYQVRKKGFMGFWVGRKFLYFFWCVFYVVFFSFYL